MKLNNQLLSDLFVQERPWSARLFLCLICLYLVSILLIALPDGMSTSLAPNEVANPACIHTNIQEETTKNCNPTLRLTARSTAKEYITILGYSDAASYVKAALLLNGMEVNGVSREVINYMASLSMADRLKQVNTIGFGMWPPGMFFLDALPLKLSADAPLGLYQVTVSSSLWAIAFAMIASLIATRTRLWWAVVLPFFMMSLPLFYDYFFRYGVMYSETYGAALMVIGFGLLFQVVYRKPGFILALIAGLCFAVASLLRAQVYPVAIGLSVVLLVYCSTTIWKIAFNRFVGKYPVRLAVLTAFLMGFYLPIGSYLSINNGALFFADYVWEYPFKIPAFPDAGAANFAALGGTRAACEVDLNKCEELRAKIKMGKMTYSESRAEVLKALISHPISFSAYKLPIAWTYWFEGSDKAYPQNIFILLLIVACLVYVVAQRLWLLFWSSISTCALLFAPPFLLHFEGRYFYLMKVFFLFSPLWLLLICNANTKKKVPDIVSDDSSGIS